MARTKLLNGERVQLTEQEEEARDAEEAEALAQADDPNNYPLEPYQLEAILEIEGLAGSVDAAIDAIPDPTTRAVVRARRKLSTNYRRSDPLFVTLGDTLGLTGAQIDALWMRAKDL